MALDRFRQALATLMEQAPNDPLERDEFFEVNPLPAEDGPFELVVVDEENGIFAALYLDCLFEEGDPGQEAIAALVPAYLQSAFGLEQAEWEATAPFDLGWRSRDFLWFLEFTLPGLQPPCHSDG
ncbi:hypothetical protein KQ302_08180 [Synechococcus sp. CS-602]|uniref:hypothetical protein n=1 Tax=Synechococcaceae TaxID=1890426 RepID=UPI0008FF1811|nr:MULTISPECIES: hypothetical protein [Synechococcaceae]MCT4365217.1 hypothetical protein [Candidatus Regnicoccus frigidus MAG-AL1]APD48581.1 hypothetical protein BM449_10505 [Synechococcus sp. SynAce01]MCT0205071.1 hypothetical protein [Synechococcus sp. CS-602]MCT0245826.1 hypothetical protein [Synechococcus sp. CS-601]MCT4367326.1 hypothetical protein [Candidatus Regnicoccus frigidus MAG-AL2]